MRIKTLEEAQQLQSEFSKRLRRSAESLRADDQTHDAAGVEGLERRLAAARDRLERSTEERKNALTQLDRRVERDRERVKRLEEGLGEMKDRDADADAARPTRSRSGPAKEAPQRKRKKRPKKRN